MSWEQAATITLAGNTALFFIRDIGKVNKGHRVLINGASGAIGTFAVQLAKNYGAFVTGVCSTSNLEMVKSLGADTVIDYTKEDFAEKKNEYDIIFDVVNTVPFGKCKGSLKRNGVYLAGAGQEIFNMIITSIVGNKKVKGAGATPSVANLDFLKELIENGKLQIVLDRSYSLENISEAFEYVETGHKKGSVLVHVNEQSI
ncbi:MAG: zinc-binding dehydrogenase [Candidatus Lokiarchaeota archaeon]|nr:zinc-binding dehydrogenase [Candidatus Lokiarchaeota archaeon]